MVDKCNSLSIRNVLINALLIYLRIIFQFNRNRITVIIVACEVALISYMYVGLVL